MWSSKLTRLCLAAGLSSGIVFAQPPVRGPGAVAAVPRLDTSAGVAEFFYFDLDRGDGFVIDPSRRDPRSARGRRLQENVFTTIGRPTDQPASPGEVLLGPITNGDGSVRSLIFVETSTGYTAFFDQLGKGGRLGEITSTVGRPFGPLADADGNYALLMRRGRSEAAILYHATAGKALAALDVDDRPSQPRVVPIDGLPALGGRVTAAALSRGVDATDGFVLIDGGRGDILRVALDERGLPVGTTTYDFNLFDAFSREVESSADPRFLAIPVAVDGGATRHIVIVDLGTGRMAWLANVDGAFAAPSLQALSNDWTRFLTVGGEQPRPLGVVGHTTSGGATDGAWLIDGPSGRLLYIDNFERPDNLTISAVTLDR